MNVATKGASEFQAMRMFVYRAGRVPPEDSNSKTGSDRSGAVDMDVVIQVIPELEIRKSRVSTSGPGRTVTSHGPGPTVPVRAVTWLLLGAAQPGS
jgi:hypothetical protein